MTHLLGHGEYGKLDGFLGEQGETGDGGWGLILEFQKLPTKHRDDSLFLV